MTVRLLATLLRQSGGADPPESDGALLARHLARRDEDAFAALVRRHGPMVWAVCRHALPAEADAEDAFQATFLALLRQARHVRRDVNLGPWLHRVAVRACQQARRAAGRRQARERRAALARPDHVKPGDAAWADDLAHVHREIARLPRREHEVFVLCGLEGVPQAEAAARLRLRPGSVSGLLSRARQRLRGRLAARGALSLAALGLAASCPAVVPQSLLTKAFALSSPSAVLSQSVLTLSRSLVEVTMRKSLLSFLVLTALGGAAAIPFLIGSAGAQDPGIRTPFGGQDQFGSRGGPAVGTPANASGWEYKIIEASESGPSAESTLNHLGTQGWELCATHPASGSKRVAYVFKRSRAMQTAEEDRRRQANADLEQEQRKLQVDRSAARWLGGGDQASAGGGGGGATVKGGMVNTGGGGGATQPAGGSPAADGQGATDYFSFRLHRTEAVRVAEVLRKVYADAVIVTDVRTNTLHVQALTRQAPDIKKALEQLEGDKNPQGQDRPK